MDAQRYVNVLLFKEEHLMQGSWKGHISSVIENNGLFAEMYPTYNEDYKIRSYDVVQKIMQG
jgi:hypothetical protein